MPKINEKEPFLVRFLKERKKKKKKAGVRTSPFMLAESRKKAEKLAKNL